MSTFDIEMVELCMRLKDGADKAYVLERLPWFSIRSNPKSWYCFDDNSEYITVMTIPFEVTNIKSYFGPQWDQFEVTKEEDLWETNNWV